MGLEKFRVKHALPGPGGGELLQPGLYAREQLSHCNLPWLIQSGAAELVGGTAAVSLLPDNPTEQDFRDEIQRMQATIEGQAAELDAVRNAPPVNKSFPGVKTGMTMEEAKKAAGEAVAADALGRKLREAEDRAVNAEKAAVRMDADLKRAIGERDKLAARVTQLEADLAAAKRPA